MISITAPRQSFDALQILPLFCERHKRTTKRGGAKIWVKESVVMHTVAFFLDLKVLCVIFWRID